MIPAWISVNVNQGHPILHLGGQSAKHLADFITQTQSYLANQLIARISESVWGQDSADFVVD